MKSLLCDGRPSNNILLVSVYENSKHRKEKGNRWKKRMERLAIGLLIPKKIRHISCLRNVHSIPVNQRMASCSVVPSNSKPFQQPAVKLAQPVIKPVYSHRDIL